MEGQSWAASKIELQNKFLPSYKVSTLDFELSTFVYTSNMKYEFLQQVKCCQVWCEINTILYVDVVHSVSHF